MLRMLRIFDGGFIIPNFADAYSGSAPDIGAHEDGQPPLEFGINTYVTVKEPPLAVADHYSTQRATSLDVQALGVRVLNSAGSFSYSPDTDFTGTDSFAYKISDGEMESSAATVTIEVGDSSPYLQEPGPQGIVSLEAEHPHINSPSADHAWALRNDTAGYSGSGFIRAEPDAGVILNTGFVATSPRLDYRVIFRQTGRYYVWVRKYSTGGLNDSCHVGLSGAATATSDRIDAFADPNIWA